MTLIGVASAGGSPLPRSTPRFLCGLKLVPSKGQTLQQVTLCFSSDRQPGAGNN
jgi:hypothetical protein